MKRFSFISRLATSLALVSMTLGTTVLVSCDDDDPVVTEPALTPLATPASPASTEVGPFSLSFSWSGVEKASRYAAQVRENQFGDVIGEVVTELTSATFSDLKDKTTYYFRVRAVDDINELRNSAWTEWISVTTLNGDQYEPLATPQDVICDMSRTTPESLTFTWAVVEKAASYAWQLLDEAGNVVKSEVTAELSATIRALDSGATYTFMVQAKPEEGSQTLTVSSFSKGVQATTVGKLATPAGVENTLRMAEALSFRWEAVEGAAAYEYVLSAGEDVATAAVVKTETTTNTEVAFIGLNKDAYYAFQVKAVPAEGANCVASEYAPAVVVKTLVTDATPVATPQPAVKRVDQVSATVAWAPVTGARSYEYQWGATTAEAEAAEATKIEPNELGVLASELEKSGLTAGTTYYVRVKACSDPEDTSKIDSEYSVWVEVTTPAKVDALTVEAGNDAVLKNLDGYVNEGAVVTLKSGRYNLVSSTNEAMAFALTVGVTLKGESATDRPVVNYKSLSLGTTGDASKIRLENIVFTGFKPNAETGAVTDSGYAADKSTTQGGYAIDNDKSSGEIAALEVVNCDFYGFNNAFIRTDRGKAEIRSILVENCFVSVGGDNGQLIGSQKDTKSKKVVIRNSTFDHIGSAYGGQALGGSKNAALVRLSAVEGTTATIENCTFYMTAGCSKNKTFVECKGGVTTFNKNVIVMDPAIAGGPWSAKLSNGDMTGADNFICNVAADWAAQEGVTVTVLDPAISGYAWKSNYKPTAGAVVAAGAGDSRWLK